MQSLWKPGTIILDIEGNIPHEMKCVNHIDNFVVSIECFMIYNKHNKQINLIELTI